MWETRRLNKLIKFHDLQKMWEWMKSWKTKKNEDGEDLGGFQLDDRDNDSQYTANEGRKGTINFYLPGVGSRRTRSGVTMRRKRREGWLQHCPLRMTRLAACTHFLSYVKRSKHFPLHLILTLSWCLKNKIRSWWENFALSYNPFFRLVQITILATPRIARNTTHLSPWNWGKTLSTM